MKVMKRSVTTVFIVSSKRLSFIFLYLTLTFLSSVSSAQIFNLLSREEFPVTYNTGYASPVNSSFEGKIGNWNAYSNNSLSSVAIKDFPDAYSLPNSAELVNNSNTGSSQSYIELTSPEISLSGIMCTGKIDLFCRIYGEQLSAANTGTMLKIELFNGSTWNTIWQKNAAQLLSDYGLQNWAQVYIMLNPSYYVPNFKYRFVLSTPAGNNNTTKVRIDDCEIFDYSCGSKASLGNLVWLDANGNGIQDSGEKGYKGMTVDLKNSSNTIIASTITGDDGGYHFIGIDPGTYSVHFRPFTTGYVNSPKNQGSNIAMDSDPDVITGDVSVTLVANEFNTTLDFGLAPAQTLPVHLLSFNAVYNKNTDMANLIWRIDNNTDLNRFELERSTDGRNFSVQGILFPSEGNSLSYQFPDNLSRVEENVIYYRLAMVEKNGEMKYSKIATIRKNISVATGSLQLAPNPAIATSSVKMIADAEGIALVKLLDMSGKMVKSFNTNVAEGVNAIQLNNLDKHQRGFYIVQVQMNNQTWSSRLILQ